MCWFFFCDQLRRDILALYGGGIVRTPNLDALGAQSCVFENAHTPTAICSPARASLMTGLYPHAHHMFNNSTPSYSMGAPARKFGGNCGTMDIPMHEFPDVVTADMTREFLDARDRASLLTSANCACWAPPAIPPAKMIRISRNFWPASFPTWN